MRTAADFDQPDAGRRRVRRRGPMLRRWERQLTVAITIAVTAILTALSVWGFIAAERNRWTFALIAVVVVMVCAFASWLAWHRVPIRTTLRPGEMPWSSRTAIFAYWRRDDVDRRALLPVWSAEFAIMRWSATTSSRTSTFPKSRQFVVCPAAWR